MEFNFKEKVFDMKTLTLYYSVSNGGDGSAYPKFSLSEKAVEIHQDIENQFREGWGEDCTGQIELVSDSDISVSENYNKHLITKESLIKSLDYYLQGGYGKSEEIKRRAEIMLKRINDEL